MSKAEELDTIFQWAQEAQPAIPEIGWLHYTKMKRELKGKIPEFKYEWEYQGYIKEDPRFEAEFYTFRLKRDEPWPEEFTEDCLFYCLVELCRARISKQQDQMSLDELGKATTYAPMTIYQTLSPRKSRFVEKVDKSTYRLVLDPRTPIWLKSTPRGAKRSRLTSLLEEVVGGPVPVSAPITSVPAMDMSRLYSLLQFVNAGIGERQLELANLKKGIAELEQSVTSREAELERLEQEKAELLALLPDSAAPTS